jgi:hypothetical protein
MQLYIYPLAGSATIPVQRSNQLSYDSGVALKPTELHYRALQSKLLLQVSIHKNLSTNWYRVPMSKIQMDKIEPSIHCKNRLVEMTNLNWLSQTY